jgi:CRP-like cAMP-binding protein
MHRTDPILNQLKNVPLFSACSNDELALILGHTTLLRFAAGSALTTEGQGGHEFLVIVEGSANVTIRRRHVATLGAGDFFGEISLLDRGPRTATVTAKSDLLAYVSSEREFQQLITDAPHLAQRMLIGLAHRLREADTLLSA